MNVYSRRAGRLLSLDNGRATGPQNAPLVQDGRTQREMVRTPARPDGGLLRGIANVLPAALAAWALIAAAGMLLWGVL